MLRAFADLADTTPGPERDDGAAGGLQPLLEHTQLGPSLLHRFRLLKGRGEMRAEQIECKAIALVEVQRLAPHTDMQLARPSRAQRDRQYVLDVRRPIKLGVYGAIAPFAPANQIAEPDRLVNTDLGVPIPDEGKLVHMARERFNAVGDPRSGVRNPLDAAPLRIGFAEDAADIGRDDSGEAIHDLGLVSIDGPGRVQLVDEFQDRTKVVLAQMRHEPPRTR